MLSENGGHLNGLNVLEYCDISIALVIKTPAGNNIKILHFNMWNEDNTIKSEEIKT